MELSPTRTHAEFTAGAPLKGRLRSAARDVALRGLALGGRIDGRSNWIRFPYFHHVFEDERAGFTRQMDYLRGFGDFISLDDATSLLASGNPIDGRYFCVTFDDGFKCCHWGALPILAERDVPAAFFLVTGFMGRSLPPDDPAAREVFGFRGRGTTLDFLSWDECREMANAGMTFGAHTRGHANLAQVEADAALAEMRGSKDDIERELTTACRHFCAPYGVPHTHFDPARDPALAREAGYSSFITTRRGPNRRGADVFALRRDHMLAAWGNHQLRYFLSRS